MSAATATRSAKTTRSPRAASTGSTDDRNTILKDMRRELVTGAPENALGYVTRWAQFEVNSRRVHGLFPRLSASNRLLLEHQRRTSGENWRWLLAGVEQWSKLDRQPKKDAVAKSIWLPKIMKKDPAQVQPGESDTIVRGFIKKAVYFDYTDTISTVEGFVEPNLDAPIAAGDEATFAALQTAGLALGVQSTLAPLGGAGNLVSAPGSVTIEESLPLGNQIKALARGLVSHALGHTQRIALAAPVDVKDVSDVCEQEAILGELVVMKMLGLDVDGAITASAATAYLLNWVAADGEEIAGHKKRMALLDERIEPAMDAAGLVVDAYLAAKNV